MKKNKLVMVFIFSICKLCYAFDGDIAPFNYFSRAYIGMMYTQTEYNLGRSAFVNCGGTLITQGGKNYFVTAYHCIEKLDFKPLLSKLDKPFKPRDLYVYLPPVGIRNNNMRMANSLFGKADSFEDFWLSFLPDPLSIIKIKANNIYYMNPKEWGLDYVPDLAVLELSGNVKRNNQYTIEPIPLDQVGLYESGDARVFGWAHNQDFEFGGQLKYALVSAMYPFPYGNREYGVIKTRNIGTGGDSGSPLIVADLSWSKVYLHGVASYIPNGADTGVIYYTNLALPPIHYWLKSVLAGKQIPSCTVGSTCNDYSLRPQGSYLDTCTNVRWDFPNLTARCANSKGQYVSPSTLNYFSDCYTGKSAKPYPSPSITTAGSTVSNMNGKLRCDVNTNVPPGDYLRTCKVYSWKEGTLSATCEKNSIFGTTSKVNSTIIPGQCRRVRTDYNVPWIINNNGVLTCGTPS